MYDHPEPARQAQCPERADVRGARERAGMPAEDPAIRVVVIAGPGYQR
jgi:hypothetical protein